jgi:hypothetical protein
MYCVNLQSPGLEPGGECRPDIDDAYDNGQASCAPAYQAAYFNSGLYLDDTDLFYRFLDNSAKNCLCTKLNIKFLYNSCFACTDLKKKLFLVRRN